MFYQTASIISLSVLIASMSEAVELPTSLAEGPFAGYLQAIGTLTQVSCVYRDVSAHSTTPWKDDKYRKPDLCTYVLVVQSGTDYAVRVRDNCDFNSAPDFSAQSEEAHAEIGFSCVDGTILAQGWGSDGISRVNHSSRSKTPWALNSVAFSPWPNPLLNFIVYCDLVQSDSIAGPIGINTLTNPGFISSLAAQSTFSLGSEHDGVKSWNHQLPSANNEYGGQIVDRRTEVDTKAFPEMPGIQLPVAIRKYFTYPGQKSCVSPQSLTYRFVRDGRGNTVPIPDKSLLEDHISFVANGTIHERFNYNLQELLTVTVGSEIDRSLLTLDTGSANMPLQQPSSIGGNKEH